ncbi:uncharacterized protein MEPE_04533 [Melanopsichium pennsylvanicum]|uniref:HPP transmembrane region domain-containing protein n=2 Tax=Melanopsichium pennsylvanicum TaxID=63383 RepID=A0AAJ4XMX4_9BASI|nr:conserved hypothetical protein [Melanopsichium pennsylvanicum 4]SNX85824.1 uncharacterized protein MEPE_04533 [Melanopsichium pennsylvanicum]
MSKEQDSSAADVVSTHAPTTIPEEPTPVSSVSPGIPLDSRSSLQAQQSQFEQQSAQSTRPQEGRFIEIISTDGSRASAEHNAESSQSKPAATTPGRVPEMEMKSARASSKQVSSNVFRRNSKKSNAQPSKLLATTHSSNAHGQEISPVTDSSTQKDSPHPNDSTSPSTEGGRPFRSFKKIKGERSEKRDDSSCNQDHDSDTDYDDETHPILAALYPLTNFIGYRPLSHPHTPSERRRTPKHPRFNRFHYICGRILTLGLPVSGDTGEIARYRDPDTGDIHLVTMYKDQVGAKVVNSIHSVIAAWVIVALLCLVSRSPFHRSHNSPLIIGAFATEAVVTFFAFRTPLAQPKNILFGNTISSIIGVGMQKAFAHTNYDLDTVYGVDWAAAATSVAVAIFGMQILGFTHPPGAAISLLSITNKKTLQLEWWLVPIVVIASCIVIGWAMLINNVGGRRYPENWFYANAFREPPIIGPEKLPFTNSPYEPRPSRHATVKRKRARGEEEENEKGFYRVPDSGARVTNGFGSSKGLEPKSSDTAATTAGTASYTLGGADRVRHLHQQSEAEALNNPNSFRQSFGPRGVNGDNNINGADGRTTRASEVTKVDPVELNSAIQPAQKVFTLESTQAGRSTQSAQAVTSSSTAAASSSAQKPKDATEGAGGGGEVKSRMIETDVMLISRNDSKGSKKSRRSIVIHVNEKRRHSTGGSGGKGVTSPVPAVQWRGRNPI